MHGLDRVTIFCLDEFFLEMNGEMSSERCVCDSGVRTRQVTSALQNICELCGKRIIVDITSGEHLNGEVSPIERDAVCPGNGQFSADLSEVTYANTHDEDIRVESAELCRCSGAVTRQFVLDSGNKCPGCSRPLRNLQSTVRLGSSVT